MKLTLLLAILAQLIPGLWFLDAPLEKKGLRKLMMDREA